MGKEILSLDQSRLIEQAKFTYSPLGKAFEKHKNNWRSSWSFKSFKTSGTSTKIVTEWRNFSKRFRKQWN